MEIKGTQNTFMEGLNKDVTPLKFKNTQYYHLENGHIITTDGNTTGRIEPEKSDSILFTIPTLIFNGEFNIIIGNQTIIGIKDNNSFLIIFSVSTSTPSLKALILLFLLLAQSQPARLFQWRVTRMNLVYTVY